MLKKFFLIVFLSIFIVPNIAFAKVDLGEGIVKKAGKTAGYAQANETTLSEMIGSIIKTVLSLVGIIFTVLMVYAGYLWMTARGEASQVEKAQEIIKSSIIGIIITLAAYSISNFVVSKILEKTSASSETPIERLS
jgi:hypothetical protein